jgi:hypothetical protein
MRTEEIVDHNQQTRACQQLLASVIATAINDACAEPFRATRKDKTLRMRYETITAFRFLFDETVSGIESFALWLDFNESLFRRKLLETMANDSQLVVAGKNPEMRRNFRYNYKLWKKLSTIDVPPEPEEDDNDRLVRRTIEVKLTR